MGAFSCHIAKVEQGGFKRGFKVEDRGQERIKKSWTPILVLLEKKVASFGT